MTIREYADKVADIIPGVKVVEVEKNNNVKKTGIERMAGNVHPVVYIDEMYDQEMSIIDAAKEVMDIMTRSNMSINVEIYKDYENIKDNLVAKLVNQNSNFEGVSAKKYGFVDLKIVPIVKVNDNASIRVTKEICKNWGVSMTKVVNQALENIKDDVIVKSYARFMGERMGASEVQIAALEEGIQMMIITNKEMINGAIAALFAKERLNKIYNESYTILPSSIHEVIAVPTSLGNDFATMVQSVNETCVDPEEVLSDKAYIF